MPKKILHGTVISKKMDKTISVLVDRYVEHPRYRKMIKRSKRYAVHDALNEYSEGETVKIIESRPLSKTKRWVVYKV
ncbi:30S ribosomal protein S17 [Candidatus Lariskella endosymbiont of Hedychridium roseum]|uniref:30S ribosomal protein S17 n=1 Tax=Candidatus Lariskella endosymbiont of Hedychridium roseum TaxID=3077949 RepID=UPI0030D0B23C